MTHTKDKLADALFAAGLFDMSLKARDGYYHDYLSPLDFPDLQLEQDLRQAGTEAAMALRDRHLNGEFDASKEESDEWAASDDFKEAMATLFGSAKK